MQITISDIREIDWYQN